MLSILLKTSQRVNLLTFTNLSANKIQSINSPKPSLFLQPVAGLKRRVTVHKMCEDCQFTKVHGRLAIACPTHGRHNQLQFRKGKQKQLYSNYAWRWPDPFEKKYSENGIWFENRYLNAFK